LYCTAAYPFDHIGDSAINTTRVVPDSGDYLESIRQTSPWEIPFSWAALDDSSPPERAQAEPAHGKAARRTDLAVISAAEDLAETPRAAPWKRDKHALPV
jgi:hypothetical protein